MTRPGDVDSGRITRVDLDLTFRLHDRPGTVHITVDAISDGCSAGFDILPGLPFGPDETIGFPSMLATIDYSGTGYRATAAWIQLLTIDRYRTESPTADRWIGVDLPPHLYVAGIPFYSIGTAPTLFDAPSNNLSGADWLDWRADTFLVRAPLRLRTEPITPLAGFSWGYSEFSDRRPPQLSPLTPSTSSTWDSHRELLSAEYPTWTFGLGNDTRT
jgi:hypothetical protein